MSFKKHSWIKYGRSGNVMEIIIRDDNMSKTDSFKCNINDKKATNNIFKILKDKYNVDFKPEISAEESVNSKQKDWLDKDFDW